MKYFWIKYDLLGQKSYASQIRPYWGPNSSPPDHDSTFHVTETPALTTRPSVTADKIILKVAVNNTIGTMESNTYICLTVQVTDGQVVRAHA